MKRDLYKIESFVAFALAVASCSKEPIVLPSRDFERPTDMTFSCMKVTTAADRTVQIESRPMGECHPHGVQDPPIGPSTLGHEVRYVTFAYVPNSARGDLSVIDMSRCRPDDTNCFPPGAALVDLDPQGVGYGTAPLGALPEVITASQDGCRVLTANRGSCDFTFINPRALLGEYLGATSDPSQTSPYAQTVVPRTAAGDELNLAPAEVTFLPQQTAGLADKANICGDAGTLAAPVGLPPATAEAPANWRALATFPSCDLVALLDLPSGKILDSYGLISTAKTNPGVTSVQWVHTGPNPVCPRTDCGPRKVTTTCGGGGGGQGGGAAVSSATATATVAPAPPTDGGSDDGGAGGGGKTGGTAGMAGSGGAGGSGMGGAGATGGAGGSIPPPSTGSGHCGLGTAALALRPDGQRAYVGTSQAPVIATLDVAGDHLGASSPLAELHEGARGAERVRLSVDPYNRFKSSIAAPGIEYGAFVAGPHGGPPAPSEPPESPLEFLYVVARDGSIRVLDVSVNPPTECDLDIDPMKAPGALDSYRLKDRKEREMGAWPTKPDPTRIACFPYDKEGNPGKRAQPAGAGLRFGSAPLDVAFGTYYTPINTQFPRNFTKAEQVMSGAFAFVLTSNGSIYVVDIDPDLRYTAQLVYENAAGEPCVPISSEDPGCPLKADRRTPTPRPLTNSLRNHNAFTYLGGLVSTSGPPRLDTPPIGPAEGQNLLPFTTAAARATWVNALSVPQIRVVSENSVEREELIVPPTPSLPPYVFFPDPTLVIPQVWNVTWEGDLSGIRATGTVVDHGEGLKVGQGALVDYGGGFCGVGALPGDILTMTGCTEDAECGPGLACVRSTSVREKIGTFQVGGLCLRRDRAAELRDGACKNFLETIRRYEIVSSDQSKLTVMPKIDELARPAQKTAAGDLVACTVDGGECNPMGDESFTQFTCETVVGGPPGAPTRRCVQTCNPDAPNPCRAGNICVVFPDQPERANRSATGLCAQAPPLAEQCFPQLVPYKVSVGNAFLVRGTASGRIESIIEKAEPTRSCAPDDKARPELKARIPLNAPLCADSIDSTSLFSAFSSAEVPKFNPCLVISADAVPNGNNRRVWAVFQNPQLKFILAGLELPIRDGADIRFDVHGGFLPQTISPAVDAAIGVPARILVGPIPSFEQSDPSMKNPEDIVGSESPYLFVVDQRQFRANSTGVRGQILRIDPRGEVPRVDGPTTSNRYFPIQ